MSKSLTNMYFFYGADISALHDRLNTWKVRFAEKSDATLNAEEHHAPLEIEKLTHALQLQPLLGPKRLVMVTGALSESAKTQEAIASLLPSVGEKTVVIFVEESEANSQSVLARLLLDQAHVMHFPSITMSSLRNHITQTLAHHGIAIAPDALPMLSERLIGDSLRAKQELTKLVLLEERVITRDLVAAIVFAPLESRIFTLTDLIVAQKVHQAWEVLVNEIEFGTAPMQLLGLLTSQVRRIIATRDLLDRRADFSTSTFFRSSKPYTITVAKRQAQKLNLGQLYRYYERLCMADLYIKTGADPLYTLASVIRTS